jgi:vacuolar-type H+-ATPase catalytic subunit A/Vma1
MDPVDAYTTPTKQAAMLRLVVDLYDQGLKIVSEGCPAARLQNEVTLWPRLMRVKSTVPNDDTDAIRALGGEISAQLERIRKDYAR